MSRTNCHEYKDVWAREDWLYSNYFSQDTEMWRSTLEPKILQHRMHLEGISFNRQCFVPKFIWRDTWNRSHHVKKCLWACKNVRSHILHMRKVSSRPLLSTDTFCISNDSVCEQGRSWPDCMDVQADLGLGCPHVLEDVFVWHSQNNNKTNKITAFFFFFLTLVLLNKLRCHTHF